MLNHKYAETETVIYIFPYRTKYAILNRELFISLAMREMICSFILKNFTKGGNLDGP